MDVLRNIEVNFRIMKEPRGFIRVIQLVLAIFAFATICTGAMVSLSVSCYGKSNTTSNVEIKYKYPFRLANTKVLAPFCASEQSEQTPFEHISFAAAAQFFCFIGVMSFLGCIGFVIAYIVFSGVFENGSKAATADFIFTAIWSALWFIASCAWADRLANMGKTMDPSQILDDLSGGLYCGAANAKCAAGQAGNHATLVVSVLFGFLNFLVWLASLWFLYKETSWHKEPNSDTQTFDAPTGSQGNQPNYQSDPSSGTTNY